MLDETILLSLGVGIEGPTRGIDDVHRDHGRGAGDGIAVICIVVYRTNSGRLLHERSWMVKATTSARRHRGISTEPNAMRRRYLFQLLKSSGNIVHADSQAHLRLLPLLLLSLHLGHLLHKVLLLIRRVAHPSCIEHACTGHAHAHIVHHAAALNLRLGGRYGLRLKVLRL